MSNWTELDIWQYIYMENIEIPSLYLAKPRPVVKRDGVYFMVDDDRMPMEKGETPEMRSVRFRTLGCYPLTGAVESKATTLPEVIQEMLLTKTSERQSRVIDHDSSGSMEKKKMEGYFYWQLTYCGISMMLIRLEKHKQKNRNLVSYG
ncbi:MAG: sulfate adenylyltransferase subunit 2 [Glaciecola sp.]|jgi:sulfate adenylyltransferase subunit 2